jgi:hypothetical protein
MRGELVPWVLVPRFAPFAGAGTYHGAAQDVSAFQGGTLTFWRGKLLGSGAPTVRFSVQGSTDTQDWSELLHQFAPNFWFDPGEDETQVVAVPLLYKWLRVTVQLGGTTPAVNAWATGFLELRRQSA